MLPEAIPKFTDRSLPDTRTHTLNTNKPLLRFQLIHPLPQPIDQRLLFLLQGVFQVNLLPSQLKEGERNGFTEKARQGTGASFTGSHQEC